MANNYKPLKADDDLSPSRTIINGNLETLLSNSSGSAAPTTYLYLGRPYFNTSTEYLYLYVDGSWAEALNCKGNTVMAFDSEKLGGISYTSYLTGGANTYTEAQTLNNNIPLKGKLTNGTLANLSYVSASNEVVLGAPTIPLSLHYSGNAPKVYNGTNSYEIYHEGNLPPGSDPDLPNHTHDERYLKIAATAVDSAKLSSKSLTGTNDYFNKIPFISDYGITEVGNTLHFHDVDNDTKDYTVSLKQYWDDNVINPKAGLRIGTKSADFTNGPLDAALNLECGNYLTAHYARLTTESSSSAIYPALILNVANGAKPANNTGLSISHVDTPGIGPGDCLKYSVGWASVPVVESWIYGVGVFKGYTNDSRQVGFEIQRVAAGAGTTLGYADFEQLSSVNFVLVTPISGNSQATAVHVSTNGTVVTFRHSEPGGTVDILAFGFGA